MAIQNRRGAYVDFDPTKMVAGEFAVVQSGDENTDDGKALYVAPTTGSVKRIPFADELEGLVEVDDTLTEAGAAADAKKTGDEITALKDDLTKIFSNEAKQALLACFDNVAWKNGDGKEYYDALEQALASVPETYSTVLYTDGHFIINEKGSDRDANITAHGAVIAEYSPLNDLNPYVFTVASDGTTNAPWVEHNTDILSVEIGSVIKPTDMKGWFSKLANCTNFVLNKLNCSKLTSVRQLFRDCTSLQSINLSAFNTTDNTKLADMFGMFYGCSALTSVDLSGVNGQGVSTISNIFNGCSSLSNAILPDFTTNVLQRAATLFKGCVSLASVNLSNLKLWMCEEIQEMFQGCSAMQIIDVSAFDTASTTKAFNMFRDCTSLTTIYASANFVTDAMTSSYSMFLNSTNIVGGAGTVYNASHVDKAYARIDGGAGDEGYFTAKSA